MQQWSNKPLLCRELVGREQEAHVLHEALQRAITGQPQLLLLAGEAGVGKTKLCRAFIEASWSEQALVLFGQAMFQDRTLSFGPFLDAFRRYFTGHFSPATSTPAAFAALDTSVQTSLGFLLRLLPELAPLFPGVPLPKLDDPNTRLYQQQGLFHSMLVGFQALAQAEGKPLLLALEDLHWADETSLELLGFLAQRLDVNTSHPTIPLPLLILGTYRLEALPESPALRRLLVQLQSQRLLHEVRLSPLPFSEHWRCVNSILNQAVPEKFADYLFNWDEGNPFFTEELLGAMAANGQLQAQAKGWVILPDTRPHLPSSLTEAILERFQQLPDADQEVLAYASVIGRAFDFPLLAALCNRDEHTLVAMLRRAVRAQLISEVGTATPGEPERYQFRHALTREAIYDNMLTPERRLRHRAAAEMLEQLASEPSSTRRDDVARLLAEHYWRAGLPEKARPYALQEADRTRHIFAFREERYYLNMAQSSLPQDSPERLSLLQRMGQLSMSIYELADALQWLDMAKAGYLRIGDHHKALYVMANLLLAHWQIASPSLRGMVVEIEAAAKQAFAELDGGGDVELLAATALFAHYWTVHGLYSRSRPWLDRCFALYELLDDPARVPAIQLGHLTRGWFKAYRNSREAEEGIVEVRNAIDAASEYSLPDVLMIGHTTMAWLLIQWGRGDEAKRVLEEAAEHEERSGTLLPSFVLGLYYFYLGERWEQAITSLRSQIERLDRLHVACLAAAARVSLAHILLARDELADATLLLQTAQPYLESNNEYIYLAPLWWGFAKLRSIQGDPAQAQREYEHILARWKASEDTITIFPMLLDGIIFYSDTGKLERAGQWLAELEGVMELTENPVGMAALQEARGVVLAAQGDAETAISFLRQAVEAWGRLTWRYRLALAAQRLASVLLEWASISSTNRSLAQAAREEAAALLDQAEVTYIDLHVPTGIAAVHELRSATRLEAQEKRRHTLMTRYEWQGLTLREMEVLKQLAAGKTNRDIAAALHISVGTVELHISHIFARLGCETRTQAATIALERGWVKR